MWTSHTTCAESWNRTRTFSIRSSFLRHFSTSNATELDLDGRPEKWSKQRLAETTQPEQMKLVIGDVARRLGRQWDMLEDLQQFTRNIPQQHDGRINTNDQRRLQNSQVQVLETISKNIQNLQRLHRDTQRQCQQFYRNFPQNDDDDDNDKWSPLFQRQLGQACKEIYARHALTIETTAEIVIDLRGILVDRQDPNENDEADESTIPETMLQVQSIVTTFLQSRLMTQLLCDHIVDCMLHRERKPHGAISVGVNVRELAQSAIFEARHLVEASFIPITDPRDHPKEEPASAENGQDVEPPEPPHVHCIVEESAVTATLVRPWFQYALVELLKNGLAVTMERNRRDHEHSPYWPLFLHIYETEQFLVVKVLDQGGGLDGPRRHTSKAQPDSFCFEFANRRDKWDRLDDQQSYAMVSSPIRGLGVGLALSRLHLRQFGGDLTLTDHRPADERTNLPNNQELKRGVTATLLLAKDFDRMETDLYYTTGR